MEWYYYISAIFNCPVLESRAGIFSSQCFLLWSGFQVKSPYSEIFSRTWTCHNRAAAADKNLNRILQTLHPYPQYFRPDTPGQQRKPQEQLSQCVYSGSISGSIFMLSIIQLVASPGPLCLAGSRLTGAVRWERESDKGKWEKRRCNLK